MPRMRCPRCSTIVDVAAGAAPACTACGFGSAARAAAPAAAPPAAPQPTPAPVQAAAAPAPTSPAPAAGRRTGAVVAIVVAAVLVAGALAAAGWSLLGGGDAKPLTEDEAETRLAAALESMPGGLSGDGAPEDLRKMTLSTQGGAGGEDLGFGGDATVEVEWGRDGVSRIDLASGGGAVTFAMTLYCGPQGMLMVLGEESYGSRPSTGGQDACDDLDGEEGLDGESLAPVPTDDFSAQDADITIHSDGSLTAVVEPEEGGNAIIDLDSRGRLARIVFEEPDTPGMTVTMEFEYASRRAIDVPEADHLIPATLETEEAFDAATHTLTVSVTGSPEEPLRSELEVRVLDGFGGGVVQAFPLSQSTASAQGVNYTFNDADADGRLSVGDSFSLQNAAWDFSFDAVHVVYDTLADGEVNSSPMGAPGPGLAWLALAIVAVAVALRRRR